MRNVSVVAYLKIIYLRSSERTDKRFGIIRGSEFSDLFQNSAYSIYPNLVTTRRAREGGWHVMSRNGS
jgi:hypothetical protein